MLSMMEPRHENSPGGAIRAKFVRNKNTWNAVYRLRGLNFGES